MLLRTTSRRVHRTPIASWLRGQLRQQRADLSSCPPHLLHDKRQLQLEEKKLAEAAAQRKHEEMKLAMQRELEEKKLAMQRELEEKKLVETAAQRELEEKKLATQREREERRLARHAETKCFQLRL